MSLLLKALSRVEQKDQLAQLDGDLNAAQPPATAGQASNAADVSAKGLSEPVPAPTAPPADLASATSAVTQKAAQLNPAAELPGVAEPLAVSQPTVPDTANPAIERVPTIPDQDAVDLATIERAAIEQAAADEAAIEQAAFYQASVDLSAVGTSLEPPTVEVTPPPLDEIAAPSAAIPLPLHESAPRPIDPTPAPDFSDDASLEPLWEQLNKLQDLVSSDIDRGDLERFDFASLPEELPDFTMSETVQIKALDIESPPAAVPAANLPAAPQPTFALGPEVATSPMPAIPRQTAVLQPSPAAQISTRAQPTTSERPLNFKPEYRELRDQLLARLNISKHPTLLVIDAGKRVGDASWLLPLAGSIVEKLNSKGGCQPQILLVEAGGSECGIVRSLGLDSHVGLTHVLNGTTDWRTAIQPTQHPQIKLLGRGAELLRCDDPRRLADLWQVLTPQFDLILVAAGPRNQTLPNGQIDRRRHSSATAVFPHASAAVLSIELNATSQTDAVETRRLLDSRGIKVLGCIVQPI